MHDSHFPRTKVETELETRDLQSVKKREVCSLAVIGIACRLALVSARGPSLFEMSSIDAEIYLNFEIQ